MPINTATSPIGTATQRIADHVVGLRFEDLPAEVVARTKSLLIHNLGVAFRGALSEDGQRAVSLGVELSAGGGSSSIIGDARGVGLMDAVFVNSFLMGHHDLDDVILPSGLHPGVVVHPAAWATGEQVAASGRELIVAVVVGYDAMSKLADTMTMWGEAQPRLANAVFAPFGAAAAAARLRPHTRATVEHALGHAGHLGMGLIEGGNYRGSSTPSSPATASWPHTSPRPASRPHPP